jgi:hypothetical protein
MPTNRLRVIRSASAAAESRGGVAMIRLIVYLALAGASVVTSTSALARSHYYRPPATYLYDPANDPNSVFVAGTYAGSDPDPNIRAALRREFGRI